VITVPDYKGPGQWRTQATKAQGTGGSSPPTEAEKRAAAKRAAKRTPKGKDKG
jgi:hypothetical protein